MSFSANLFSAEAAPDQPPFSTLLLVTRGKPRPHEDDVRLAAAQSVLRFPGPAIQAVKEFAETAVIERWPVKPEEKFFTIYFSLSLDQRQWIIQRWPEEIPDQVPLLVLSAQQMEKEFDGYGRTGFRIAPEAVQLPLSINGSVGALSRAIQEKTDISTEEQRVKVLTYNPTRSYSGSYVVFSTKPLW